MRCLARMNSASIIHAHFIRSITSMTDSTSAFAPTLLQDRVILITGATDGIGKALAIACAKLGAQVIAHGKTQKKLEAVANAVTDPHAKPMALVPLDLEKATANDYQSVAEALQGNFGRLDALVHNAAMLGERAAVEHHDVPKWLRAMHVNTNAAFILTRYCLPLLKQSASGAIVFNTCDVATQPKAHWGAYLVSKCANEGLRQMLSEELANTRIKVSSFNPGPTNTKLRMQAYPGETRSHLQLPDNVIAGLIPLLQAR